MKLRKIVFLGIISIVVFLANVDMVNANWACDGEKNVSKKTLYCYYPNIIIKGWTMIRTATISYNDDDKVIACFGSDNGTSNNQFNAYFYDAFTKNSVDFEKLINGTKAYCPILYVAIKGDWWVSSIVKYNLGELRFGGANMTNLDFDEFVPFPKNGAIRCPGTRLERNEIAEAITEFNSSTASGTELYKMKEKIKSTCAKIETISTSELSIFLDEVIESRKKLRDLMKVNLLEIPPIDCGYVTKQYELLSTNYINATDKFNLEYPDGCEIKIKNKSDTEELKQKVEKSKQVEAQIQAKIDGYKSTIPGFGMAGEEKPYECSELLGADLVEILKVILKIIRIAVPILLILLGSVDFGSVVISQDQDAMKKALGKFVKRCIAAIVVFFIPFLVELLLSMPGIAVSSDCDL